MMLSSKYNQHYCVDSSCPGFIDCLQTKGTVGLDGAAGDGDAQNTFPRLRWRVAQFPSLPMRLLALLPDLPSTGWVERSDHISSSWVLTAHFLNFRVCSRKFWPSELLALPEIPTRENSPVGMKSARLSGTAASSTGAHSMTVNLIPLRPLP